MEAETKTLLDTIAASAQIATPFLLLVIGGIGWFIRARLERRIQLEESLRADRVRIYNTLLEPYIIQFSPDIIWANKQEKERAQQEKQRSIDYQKNSFHFSLIASDQVVRAYNAMMQNYFHHATDRNLKNLANDTYLLGQLLLEIRKSMGNESSTLDSWNMLEWFIMDVQKLRDAHRSDGT